MLRHVFLVFVVCVSALSAEGANVHIATTGNDANDGSEAKPLKTLLGARDHLRKLHHDQIPPEPATIVIHAGTYVQSATLDLDAKDSRTTWTAAPNERVAVAGGPALDPTAFRPIKDDKIAARLSADARSHVVQFDLKSLGDLPLAEYPIGFRGVPATPELFFNDARMNVARWPNSGWATIAKFVEAGSVPRDGEKPDRSPVFEYSGDEPARWNVDAGVWLQGFWCYDWYDETIRIKSIDAAKKQITLATPAVYGVKQGNPSPRRFRAMNVLEELDESGEFYIDRASRVLYFWPPGPMKDARIVISTLNAPLLRIKDAEDVTIRGLTFEAGLGDGIVINGGRENVIADCSVRNMRELGIRINGGERHRVDGCDVTDTGTGGLHMAGGDRKTLTPAGHKATNNHIWNFSQHQLTGAYAIVLSGVGNLAAHNHIHDAPHQAILIDGNDHVIEFNKIDHVVTASDDAGAVYKGRNPSCRGNVFRYNFFSDVGTAMGTGTGAIYFDDGDGGDLVFGNVFLRAGHPGGGAFGTIFSHGGHGIRAENNIFVDCERALGSAPWDDARWKNALNGGEDCHFPEKLLKDVDITKPPYTTRYPELVGFMDPKPGAPRVSTARNNVLVRCAQPNGGNWQTPAGEVWQTDSDPGFVDVSKGDYRLRPDSEVFKRLPGFKPIPFEQIGPTSRPRS